jgi:hypothetical protein
MDLVLLRNGLCGSQYIDYARLDDHGFIPGRG